MNERSKSIESMAVSKQLISDEYQEYEEEEEILITSGESDPYDDSEEDPSYSELEETSARFSNLSIKKNSKSRIFKDSGVGVEKDQEESEVDEKDFEIVQKIIKAGQLEKLKVEQCKVYLRKHGLRLTGNKNTLIARIKEHLEISDGEAEKKYPVSSFIINCKGDACTRDVVLFEQNVYEMFNLASHSAIGPPCGKRVVAGRIVKESYGAAKQQHTFTIEVLWSKGEKPLPPLHPLLIKGRNLYRLKTLRQRWEDEGERQRVLMEKHSRGSLARCDRETRVQVKEMRKLLKANRIPGKKDSIGNHSQPNLMAKQNTEIPSQPPDQFAFSNPVVIRRQQPVVLQPQQPALFFDPRNSRIQHLKPRVQLHQPGVSTDRMIPSTQTQRSFDPVAVNVRNHDSRQFQADHRRPNYYLDRQPLKNVNEIHPMNRPHQGYAKRQQCRYYPLGRCHFGDNCKFEH